MEGEMGREGGQKGRVGAGQGKEREGEVEGLDKVGAETNAAAPSVHELPTCEMCDSEYAASPQRHQLGAQLHSVRCSKATKTFSKFCRLQAFGQAFQILTVQILTVQFSTVPYMHQWVKSRSRNLLQLRSLQLRSLDFDCPGFDCPDFDCPGICRDTDLHRFGNQSDPLGRSVKWRNVLLPTCRSIQHVAVFSCHLYNCTDRELSGWGKCPGGICPKGEFQREMSSQAIKSHRGQRSGSPQQNQCEIESRQLGFALSNVIIPGASTGSRAN